MILKMGSMSQNLDISTMVLTVYLYKLDENTKSVNKVNRFQHF